ncbi:hypothetical protein [Pararhizobium sp.]|uniref:hypothetical protein n=1 Tax=Pararhizobium sp. TaxID=1977563 RepID=UPI0027235C42|nr:hypothetical protein [Pararhizobium sp.]MDO9416013.1 hypothetical protein [Pararhizobium sp.]
MDGFEEGILAACAGEPRTANPYALGSEKWERWNAGYESVEAMDEDGELLDD